MMKGHVVQDKIETVLEEDRCRLILDSAPEDRLSEMKV